MRATPSNNNLIVNLIDFGQIEFIYNDQYTLDAFVWYRNLKIYSINYNIILTGQCLTHTHTVQKVYHHFGAI